MTEKQLIILLGCFLLFFYIFRRIRLTQNNKGGGNIFIADTLGGLL